MRMRAKATVASASSFSYFICSLHCLLTSLRSSALGASPLFSLARNDLIPEHNSWLFFVIIEPHLAPWSCALAYPETLSSQIKEIPIAPQQDFMARSPLLTAQGRLQRLCELMKLQLSRDQSGHCH